jgi:hypothetical protein
MIGMSKKKMLSPKQYAEKVQKPYTTVMTWLQGGVIPEAVKHTTPTGHYWEIPEGTKPPELKPGPKPKANGAAKKKGRK